MGGHRAGDEASRLAIDALEHEIGNPRAAGRPPRERLEAAFAAAVRAVARAAEDPDRNGMGTTLVVALLDRGRICVAHAGDSEAWLIRSDGAERLTRPHTLIEDELAAGHITESEALGHPFRHAVSRALGDEGVEPDVAEIAEPAAGAVLLLGSDGLLGPLAEQDVLAELTAAPDLDAAVRQLVLRAIERGSQDNVSAVAAEFGRFPWRRRRRWPLAAALVLAGLAAAGGLALAIERFAVRSEAESLHREDSRARQEGGTTSRIVPAAATLADSGPGAAAGEGMEALVTCPPVFAEVPNREPASGGAEILVRVVVDAEGRVRDARVMDRGLHPLIRARVEQQARSCRWDPPPTAEGTVERVATLVLRRGNEE
jgi:protein phosphatase